MSAVSPAWPLDWWRPAPPARARAGPTVDDPGGAVPFWALVVLTVVMLLAPQEFFPVLSPLRLALVSALFAAGAHVVHARARGEAVLVTGPEMRTCLLLVGWAVVTVPFSIWPGGSIGLLIDLYLKSVVVFWLLGSIVQSTGRLRQIAWVLSLIALPLALTGVTHLATGDFSANGAASSRIVGYDAGLVRNPNDLALMLNLILPLTLALMMTERGRAARFVLAGIAVAEAAGVVATFSRSGFVTLAAILGMLLWRVGRRPGSSWLWIGLAGALLTVPVLPGSYLERISTIADKDSDPTGSSQERWSDQVVALEHVGAHPIIGAGIGNDVLALNDLRGAKWRQVHDAYLEYAVDLGLPGLVLFVVLMGQSLYAVNAVRRRCLDAGNAPALLAIAEGVWISLMAFAVAGFFHPVAYHAYFYYMAGLAMAVKATARGGVTA